MATEEKQASNFELNVLKIGINRFQLRKGDRFTTNGSAFNYKPSTPENRAKMPFSRYHRSESISAVKYKKDVLRADNIELVVDKYIYSGTEEQMKAEIERRKDENDGKGWQPTRWQEWEVKYSYEIPEEELETLITLYLVLGKREGQPTWKFETAELEVERDTKENYFLKKNHPLTFHSKIEKTDLYNVHVHYGTYHIMGKVEKYHEMETALYKYAEESERNKIESAKAHLKQMEENLSKFLTFKETQGY